MRPTLSVLSDSLREQILGDAKRILAERGIEVRGRQLRARLLEHGIKTDPASGRLLLPQEMVEQAIASTPKRVTLYDREGVPHAELGGNNVHFVPGSSGLQVLDHRTGQTRLATTADFVAYVRLADGLQHIAYLATAFSTNDDIEPQVSDAWRLYLCLTNSIQPIVSGAFTEHGVPRMAEMLALFRDGREDLRARPLSIFTITASGMFRYSEDSCQNLLDCVEWGIPIEVVPVTLMGLIAPVTLVGATTFHVADTLAGLTMAQVIRPGAPVIFGGAPATFHMKAATSPMIAVEAMHLDMAYVEVAKALGLPTQSYLALSEGKFIDAQAGAETFGSALLAALAGINSVSGPGMLDYLMVFSLEKLLFDDELCGQALHFVQTMTPRADLPADGLVQQLLDEQHLLTAEHTTTHWPDALYLPGPTIDRDNRENWQKKGSPQLGARLKAGVEERLASYEPVPPAKEVDAALRAILTSGLVEQRALPPVPSPPKRSPRRSAPGRRRRKYQRGRGD